MVNNIAKTFRPAYERRGTPSRVVCVLCLLISSFFYLTAVTNTVSAATYYLDAVNGNDNNPGTTGEPWKTIDRAKHTSTSDPNVDPGDTVILRTGEYGSWTWNNVENTGDWITYIAEEGATPHFWQIRFVNPSVDYACHIIIDGMSITWDNHEGPEITLVQFKEASYIKLKNSYMEGLLHPDTGRAIKIGGLSYEKPCQYIEIDNCEITSSGAGITGYYIGDPDGDVENGLIVKNCNIHNLYDDAISISAISNSTFKDNELHDLSVLGNTKYIDGNDTISGSLTVGETVTQGAASGVVKSQLTSNGHQYIFIEGDEFTEWSVGVEVTGQTSGVTYTPTVCETTSHADAIQLYAPVPRIQTLKNITIKGNKIYDTRGQGIFLMQQENLLIENNLIYGEFLASSIKVHNDSISGTVRNNTICKTVSTQADISFESNIHAWAINQSYRQGYNVLYDGTGYRSLLIHVSDNNNKPPNETYWQEISVITFTVYNNLTCRNILFSNEFGQVLDEGYNITGIFSMYDNPPHSANDYEYGHAPLIDEEIAALFVDPDNNDFQLKADSKAINFGNSIYAPSTDILGNTRDASPDAGCYESSPSDPNNPTPVLQVIGDKSVDENVALAFTVNATDPNGEPITYSAQGLPSGATLDPLSGEFAWTPSYNQAGSYQVTFRASDGNSWDSETITITVNNVNRPPVIGAITEQSVNENALLSLSVNATDPDGQALTYSISGLPAGAVFASQTLTWTPAYDQAGTFPVTFTADDGQAQDSEAITITVINVNRTPVLAAINNQSVWSDDPLTFTIDATDPDGDAVTYSAGALPTGATFTGQDFDWTPSQGQMGSYDVTFIATDGQLQDSQIVTITVDVDSLAPAVTNSLPTAGSIQAPLNNLINLNITDAGKGIEADSVTIKVNNNTVYAGDTNHYSSPDGECRRLGNKADYRFVYQSNEEFDYDQTVSITVNATDLAGNIMDEYSYSFATEMHSFGQNKQVNSGSVNLNSGRPVTVRDSSGNIWAAWHAGPIDNRDIYIGKLAAGEENFGGTVQLTDNTTDQYNPAVALDSSDKLYVVWQDNREGDWDIYVSTSVDGISWTTETRVNDPNDGDQVNPAIVIDGQSPNQAYVVWQDDRAGSQDICVATSSDGFVTTTVSQITSHISDQVEPAIAADSDNTIYIVWTDGRNGSNDIYGAASNNGLWNNVPVVTEDDGQSSPAIATEAVGSILHLVWVDDRLGDDDIYYDKTVAGLSPLTGSSIIDDTTGADQISPVIITTGYTGNDLKVFVCWRDERNADADLYFVEIGSDNETNVFVGDDGTSTDQSEPAIGIDGDDYPYLVWTNERTDIYYAGSTFVEPVALASTNVSISSTATVGTVWNAVNSLDDVSAEVPQGAYLCDVKITISKIKNPPKSNLELDLFSGTYEFGPSGMEFIEPVTITIPYEVNGSENVLYTAYWYNPLTNTLSQQGITDVETIVISSTLHAVRFKTTHFSAFILGGGVAAALGGGGGGCSVSAGSEGNIVEFILPYIGLAVVMAILKVRDTRYRKARST